MSDRRSSRQHAVELLRTAHAFDKSPVSSGIKTHVAVLPIVAIVENPWKEIPDSQGGKRHFFKQFQIRLLDKRLQRRGFGRSCVGCPQADQTEIIGLAADQVGGPSRRMWRKERP